MSLQNHPTYSALMLEYFIDQLAEYIVLDSDVLCGVCVRGSCDHQVSGLTCRNGIKAWLLERQAEFAENLPDTLEEAFAYLDELQASGITNMYAAAPYLEKKFPQWSKAWHKSVLKLWMDTYQERMAGQ